jgi:hypothetical protein
MGAHRRHRAGWAGRVEHEEGFVTASEWWWVVAVVVAVVAGVAYLVPQAVRYAATLAAFAVGALAVGFLVLP